MRSAFLAICVLLVGLAIGQVDRGASFRVEPKIESIPGTDAPLLLYSFLPKGIERRTTIIMLAGGDGAKRIGKIAPIHYEFAEQMVGYGYAVYALDYRNPQRHFLDDRWVDDIALGIHAIRRQPSVDSESIFIAGFSMGGTNGVRYLERDSSIRGIVCYGSPMSFKKSSLREMIGEDRMPIRGIQQWSAPLLFFQGLADEITTPDQSKEFVDSLKAMQHRVEYIIYPGAQHGFTYRGANHGKVQYDREAAFDSYAKTHAFIENILHGTENHERE